MPYVAGVDLGTTFSAAAIAGPDGVAAIDLGTRTMVMPSVVAVRSDGTILTGETAERRAVLEPGRAAREFKRRLGDPTPLLLGGIPYGAESLSGHLLRAIVDLITERQGEPPTILGLSHPANYGAYKLDLLEEAGRLAAVDAVVFVPEPVAAAVHYSQSERVAPGDLIAVYDLGGGTFDASVVQRTEDGFDVIGRPEGMERFGGIDMDEAVLGHVRNVLGDELLQVDAADPAVVAALARLREECRNAKEALSGDTEVSVPVMLPGLHTEVRLTRVEFEDMIRPRLRETIGVLERAVASAGASFDDLDRVLLVGGSSRIPLVAEMVRQASGKPVALDAHPKLTVALGTARAAAAQYEREKPQAVASGVGATDEGAEPAGAAFVEGPDGPGSGETAPPRSRTETRRGAGGRRLARTGRTFWLAIAGTLVVVGGIVAALFLRGGDDLSAGTTRATSTTSPSSPPTTVPANLPTTSEPAGGSVAVPGVVGPDPSDRILAFYSASYRTPEVDGEWGGWDSLGASPPEDICCEFYPELGPYSSADPAVVAQHFAWLREAGIGIVALQWWGPGSPEDALVPAILDAADRYGLGVAFAMEPREGRDPSSLAEDIAYLSRTYGDHPAYYRTDADTPHLDAGSRGLFLVREPDRDGLTPTDWAADLDAVHALPDGGVVIAEGTEVSWIVVGGFDGLFNPPGDAADGYGWAATLPDRAWYLPTVSPRVGSAGPPVSSFRQQPAGAVFEAQWAAALDVGVNPALVAVASFNDWLGATQIEPAATPAPAGPGLDYRDYGSLGSTGYLDLSLQLRADLDAASFPETVALQVRMSSSADWATLSIEGATWIRPTEAFLTANARASWAPEWNREGSPVIRLSVDEPIEEVPVELVLSLRVPSSDLADALLVIEQGCSGLVEIEVSELREGPPGVLAIGKGPEECGARSSIALTESGEGNGASTTVPASSTTIAVSPTTTTTAPSASTTSISTTTTTTAGTRVSVPYIVGRMREEAIRMLQDLGLAFSEDRSCFVGGGVTDEVVYQEPAAGYLMYPGGGSGNVVFFGSQFATGCSNTTVSGVVGLPSEVAVQTIENNILVPAVSEGCYDETVDPGYVVSQSPEGGSAAPQGWTVTLNVQASDCG